MQDLPESMAKLKKLERLDLGDNEIEELPPHIGALVSLEGKKLSPTSVVDPPWFNDFSADPDLAFEGFWWQKILLLKKNPI